MTTFCTIIKKIIFFLEHSTNELFVKLRNTFCKPEQIRFCGTHSAHVCNIHHELLTSLYCTGYLCNITTANQILISVNDGNTTKQQQNCSKHAIYEDLRCFIGRLSRCQIASRLYLKTQSLEGFNFEMIILHAFKITCANSTLLSVNACASALASRFHDIIIPGGRWCTTNRLVSNARPLFTSNGNLKVCAYR